MKKYLLFIMMICCSAIMQSSEYQISDLTLSATKSYWVYDYEDRGQKSFEKALSLPNIESHEKSYIYLFLGRIALEDGDIEQAENYFSESIKLYSNPYPSLILYDYFLHKNELEQANRYLKAGLRWHKDRVTQLLAGTFDADDIRFGNTRSPLDGTQDDYRTYGIMYDSSEPENLRLWSYLQQCLEQIDKLNADDSTLQPPPKEPLFSVEMIEPLNEHSSRFFFKKSVWRGDIICKLTLYNGDSDYHYDLWYEICQTRNDGMKIDTKLAVQGKIDAEGNCFFLGADGKYYPFSLMKTVGDEVIVTIYYRLKFPSWGVYDREELLRQEVIFCPKL